MASRPDPAADPDFDELCHLLQIPPRQRTLADYLKIGRLFDHFRPPNIRGPGGPKRPYATHWVPDLRERLAGRGILLSESLLYRYRKLGTFPDPAFRRACRRAKRARWEDVMRLLAVADPALRLELLALADGREADDLSVRAFKEVVRLRTGPPAPRAGSPSRAGRLTLTDAARKLEATSRRAAAQAAKWLDDDGPLAAGLAGLSDLDPADVGQVQAAIRQFRAAATRLDQSLGLLARARGR